MMRRLVLMPAASLFFVFCCSAFAQSSNKPAGAPDERAGAPGEPSQATQEHQWLKQFAGQWVTQSEAMMGPGQPPVQCQGTMSSRMLGDLWVINEVKGEMQGTQVVGLQTIGYDPAKKKYVGTWVDSMMNHLWHYEGTVDEAGKTLTLEAEGPNFMGDGKMTKFRDVYEVASADHIVASSLMLGDDGKWISFMTGNMRRQK